MVRQCSDIFIDVFDSHGGGIVRTCVCGRTFFNVMDAVDFEPGELAHLQAKSEADPDKYCAVDHTIGTMNIAGGIVIGCHCETAARYERFILAHAQQLAEYLRKHAAALREEAASLDLNKETSC